MYGCKKRTAKMSSIARSLSSDLITKSSFTNTSASLPSALSPTQNVPRAFGTMEGGERNISHWLHADEVT